MRAAFEKMIDQACLAGKVERSVLVESGVEDWVDAMQFRHDS